MKPFLGHGVPAARRPLGRLAARAVSPAVLLLAALSGRSSAQTIAEIQVSPQTLTLAVGQKQAIFAAAFDRQGNLIPSARFTFWSSDSTIARVQRDGTVVGVRPGLTKVEARAQGRRGSLAVLVAGGRSGDTAVARSPGRPDAALTLEPASLRLVVGESAQLAADALREDGSSVPTGRVTWRSLRPEVATVDSGGLVAAVAPGRTVVQAATATGLMATAPVEVDTATVVLSKTRLVLPPDGFDTLELTVPSQGNRRLGAGVRWRSSDSAVARVGPTGIVQALAPGTAEIVASGFREERRAAVVVHKLPETLVIAPRVTAGPIQLPIGESRKFSALAQAADSTTIPEIRVQWEVGDTTVARFDAADGTLTAKHLGVTSLTARVVGFRPVVWAVQVVPPAIRLERTRLGLSPGQRESVAASLLDEQSRVVGPAGQLTWTSDRPDVARVDQQGGVQGARPGHAVVTATTPWGVSARLDVFVVGQLLFASDRHGTVGIYQALATAPDSLLPVLADSAVNLQPALSPDRTRIAFSSNRANRDGNFDIYVMDADGRNPRRLTSERGTDGDPAWTSDGSRLVFASARGGISQIYIMPVDSGSARPLTNSPGGNVAPAVSPDGRSVAFVSLRDGGPRIYRMGIEGDGQRRVTTGSLREAAPHFFPNGDLAYGVERSPGAREWRIVRVPAGAAAAALCQTDQPLIGFSPSPDGERIVYVTAVQRGAGLEYRVYLRGLALSAVPVPLRLRPAEQVPTATF